MAVIPLVPETKMVDVGKNNLSRKRIGQENHVIYTHNYVRTFDFISRIWSQSHDKDCLYILSSSKNSFSHILTSSDSTHTHTHILSLSLSHTHTHFDSQRQHTHSPFLTFWLTETALSLSLSLSLHFRVPETDWPCHLVRHNSTHVT